MYIYIYMYMYIYVCIHVCMNICRLNCCEALDVVKEKGIVLPKLSCLARCNGQNFDSSFLVHLQFNCMQCRWTCVTSD
jgi:hypothetical protein